MSKTATVWIGGALVALLSCSPGLVACGGFGLQRCGEIPAGGCPTARGGSCLDRACEALYACVDGAWSRVEICEPLASGGQGGTSGSSPGGGGGGAGAAGGCETVALDHSGEEYGCQPDLQLPDCPAIAAEGCAPCLTTGCSDFFLCRAVGWVDVAYCTEQGELVVTQP